MQVLIIGGSGFAGPHVVDHLVRAGHSVTLFNRGNRPERRSDIVHIAGDRDELWKHRKEFEAVAPDVVVHMIALTRAHGAEFMNIFRGIGGRCVVASSIDVYRAFGRLHRTEPGPPDPVPLSEEAELRRQLSVHGEDYEKRWVEQEAMSDPDFPGTILRLPAVYGPGDPLRRVFQFLKRMDDGRAFILMGEEQARWRFSRGYVENVAAAIALAVMNDRSTNRIYNVADRAALSQAEWVKAIRRAAQWKGELKIVPETALPKHLTKEADFRQHWVVDSTRIRQELGYQDSVPLDEGLSRTIDWERANPPESVDQSEYDYEAEDRAFARLDSSGPVP